MGGEPRTLLNYAVPIRDEQEQVVGAVAVHVDITARKRAERELQALNEILEERVAQRTSELQASEARFRAIFEEAALGIALTDPQGRITQTNPALQAMLGYLPEELTGLTYDALFERHAAGEDGSQDAPAQEAALYGELLAGARQSYRLERSLRHRDGRPLRVRVMVSLIRDPAGVPRYAVRMLEDDTAQRETQAALLQAEKLAVTGRLAASFAHEIGNPLQSILSVLSVLRDGMAGQSEDLRLLQVAEEEIVRASNIVRQLRDLHRRSEPAERRPTDLRELLESSLLLTRQQAKSHEVAVHLEVAEDLPRVPLSADQMQQVFLNLILNGIEAMPGGGVLRVRAVRTPGHGAAADGVRLDFSDTGAGIAPEDLPRVFESFYSTKPSGLGLGLYVSHGIVQQHGGHITVRARRDRDLFSVWLPLGAGGDVRRTMDDSRTIEVIVEIPRGSRNKYEMDHETHTIYLDRVLYSSVHYPTDYGFVPHTMAADGDPLDVLIIVEEPTFPGCRLRVRPIGVLLMRDEAGIDEKILAVPVVDPRFDNVRDLSDLGPHWLVEIENFFNTYKLLEDKPTEVEGWRGRREAHDALDRYTLPQD